MNVEQDLLSASLRALVYASTIAAAGSVLFSQTFPREASAVATVLDCQIRLGATLSLVVEPLRYLVFQLAISGGDWSLAFSPEMRWMAFELPNGQAAIARIAGVLLILLAGWQRRFLSAFGAVLSIGSYALEGHTATTAASPWLGVALILHVASVHWWIGALWPLAALTATWTRSAEFVARFGRLAFPTVAILILAGALILGELLKWEINWGDAYLQLFVAKACAVCAVLAVAAYNKFHLTHMLKRTPEAAARQLRAAVSVEGAFALLVLALTGLLITTTPGMSH
jgi:putative copper export protein